MINASVNMINSEYKFFFTKLLKNYLNQENAYFEGAIIYTTSKKVVTFVSFFFNWKAEQSLQGMELKEKG